MKLANTQLSEDVLITKAKLKAEGEKNNVRKKSNGDQSKNKLSDTHTHRQPYKATEIYAVESTKGIN